MRLLLPSSLIVLCCWGCGGGASEQQQPAAPTTAVGPETGPEVARATGGVASLGERCDYGGAERFTCTGGLECCYGEHASPDGFGTCQPECDWD